MQASTAEFDEYKLRQLLSKLIRYLGSKASVAEGLFTLDPKDPEVVALRTKLHQTDTEEVDISALTQNTAAASTILVECLMQLPEPLLTFAKYDSFLMTEYILDKNERRKYRKALIAALPPLYLNTTTQVLSLLHTLMRNSVSNKLNISVVTATFAPIFLRSRFMASYQRSDALCTQRVFKDLLEDFELFGADGPLASPSKGKIDRASVHATSSFPGSPQWKQEIYGLYTHHIATSNSSVVVDTPKLEPSPYIIPMSPTQNCVKLPFTESLGELGDPHIDEAEAEFEDDSSDMDGASG